jgi:hypothetical protein
VGNNNLSANFARRAALAEVNGAAPGEALRPVTLTKTKKAKKIAAAAAADFAGVGEGEPAAARPKSVGPKLWNEFLRNYIANQASKGRKLTRLEAMAEAGPNYRRKYGLPEPKPKKTAVAAGANAVQVAPLEAPAVAKTPRARTKKAVKVLAPGNLAAVTPGRTSPPKDLATLAAELGEGEDEGSPVVSPNNWPGGNTGGAAAPAAAAAAASPLNSRGSNNNAGGAAAASPANSRRSNANAASPRAANNGAVALSPATYGYENEGMNANTGTRKVLVNGDEYFLGDNRGLFKRSGNAMEEWVGYLEPGGEIRYTNAPE